MEEPAEVRVLRGQRLQEAVREDLELYGVLELEERWAAHLGPEKMRQLRRLLIELIATLDE